WPRAKRGAQKNGPSARRRRAFRPEIARVIDSLPSRSRRAGLKGARAHRPLLAVYRALRARCNACGLMTIMRHCGRAALCVVSKIPPSLSRVAADSLGTQWERDRVVTVLEVWR